MDKQERQRLRELAAELVATSAANNVIVNASTLLALLDERDALLVKLVTNLITYRDGTLVRDDSGKWTVGNSYHWVDCTDAENDALNAVYDAIYDSLPSEGV